MRKTDLLISGFDAENLKVHFLSELGDILGTIDTRLGELRNVAQAFESFAQLDKNAKIGKARYFAFYNVAGPMGCNKSFPRAWRKILHRERKSLAVFVDARYDCFDFLIFLKNVSRMFDLLCPGNVGDMHKAIYAFFKFDKCSEISKVANAAANLGADRVTDINAIPRVFLKLLHAQTDPFFYGIDAEHLYFNLLAFVKNTFRALDAPCPRNLRDMYQTLDSGFEFDKNAVVGYRRDCTL